VKQGGERSPRLSQDNVVAVNLAFGAVERHIDAAHATAAGEITRQSRVELGDDSPVMRQGFDHGSRRSR